MNSPPRRVMDSRWFQAPDTFQIGVSNPYAISDIATYPTLYALLDRLNDPRHNDTTIMADFRKRTEHLSGAYRESTITMLRGSGPASLYTPGKFRGGTLFNLPPTVDAAIHLARYGWPAGVARVLDRLGQLSSLARMEVDAPSYIHAIAGDEVDVPAFLSGIPESMISYDITEKFDRHVRIVVDVSCRCEQCGRRYHDYEPTPPEHAMVRGAIVAMLVRLLEREKWFITLDVVSVTIHGLSRPDAIRRTQIVTVYQPGEVFDFDRIVFALANDGMMRRLLARESELWWIDRHKRNTGADLNKESSASGTIPLNHGHEDQYLPEAGHAHLFIPSMATLTDLATNVGTSDLTLGSRSLMAQLSKDNPHIVTKGSQLRDVTEGARWIVQVMENLGVEFR